MGVGIHFSQEVQSIYGLGWVELCYGLLLEVLGDGKSAVDFLPQSIEHLEETQTAIHTVRHIHLDQRLFNHP